MVFLPTNALPTDLRCVFLIFLLGCVFENLNRMFGAVVCDLALFEVRGPELGLNGEASSYQCSPTPQAK